MFQRFARIAVAGTSVGSLLGGLVDLRFSGQGLGTLLAAGLAGYGGMRIPSVATADREETRMWAMMAGMAGGGLGGVAGATAAAATVAVFGPGHLHAMDWSMVLMGGGMGGMVGATLGGAAPVHTRSRVRLSTRITVWRLRRGA